MNINPADKFSFYSLFCQFSAEPYGDGRPTLPSRTKLFFRPLPISEKKKENVFSFDLENQSDWNEERDKENRDRPETGSKVHQVQGAKLGGISELKTWTLWLR